MRLLTHFRSCFAVGFFGLSSSVFAAPPQIVTPPQAVSLSLLQPFGLSVTATGTGPFSYQWFRMGQPIPDATRLLGATHAAISVPVASFAEAGCRVIAEVASRPIVISAVSGQTLVVGLFDVGDAIELVLSALTFGYYELGVHARSGWGGLLTSYRPDGYVFFRDRSGESLVGRLALVSAFLSSPGGVYWGEWVGTVNLVAGLSFLQVEAALDRAAVDQITVTR